MRREDLKIRDRAEIASILNEPSCAGSALLIAESRISSRSVSDMRRVGLHSFGNGGKEDRHDSEETPLLL